MPKVNVYLPDDLADEVRAAKLSLSPVCQRAIREELNRMQAVHEASRDIKAVAARLNATIEDDQREQTAEGRADGVKWAREYATAAELRYIAGEFEPGRGGDFDIEHFRSMCEFMGDKAGTSVFSVRHTDEGDDGTYWLGFIQGASSVLTAVEPLLSDRRI